MLTVVTIAYADNLGTLRAEAMNILRQAMATSPTVIIKPPLPPAPPTTRKRLPTPPQALPAWPAPSHRLRKSAVLPPVEYDHPFTDGLLTITRVEGPIELRKACPGIGSKTAIGCARRFSYSCNVVIVRDDIIEAFGYEFDDVYRHEIGHCNGWPSDHPGVRNSD